MATPTTPYAYKGRDARGKLVKGRVEAPSHAAVVTRLRAMGLTPIAIDEVKTSGLQKELSLPGFEKQVDLSDIAIMTRQMATMISAGVSLLRALNIVTDQTQSAMLKRALQSVVKDVEVGNTFSDALLKQFKVFPPLMINMVRAGETGGFLEDALESIAKNYEAEVKLKAKVKSALTYPVVVLIMAIAATIGMLVFIVPVFEDMFEGLGGELPAPTLILVWLSGVMGWAFIPLVAILVACTFWWRLNKNTERVRRIVDPLKFRLPVFGDLFKKVAIARFSRNFATMVSSGVPLMQSLSIVGETSGNVVIQDALNSVQEAVRQGRSLSAPMSAQGVFPDMVSQMVAVGEDSGALDTMLSKIADFYDQEVETTTEQLTSLIEPLMIGVIGVIVGGMIISLYLPLFTVFELVNPT